MNIANMLKIAHDARQQGRAEREIEIIAILEREIGELDHDLPDAHGGNFAKKFTANLLRGVIWEINGKPEWTSEQNNPE